MQFNQIAAVLAIAATAAANPFPHWGTTTVKASPSKTSAATLPTGTDGADGWGSACKKGSNLCKESESQCSKDGGVAYKCTTIGLVNLLNCFSLLDGNTISIPITLDLLSGDTIPLSL